MVSVEEACRLALECAPRLGSENVSIANLEGRVLAVDIRAERRQPPFNRVAMDGIAIKFSSLQKRHYTVAGMQRAGMPPLGLKSPEEAIEVMTGAVLPEGTDTVVPYEYCRLENGRAEIFPESPLKAGANIHAEGSDYSEGVVLLRRGVKLTSPTIAIAASQGLEKVEVFKPPKIAIVSTGDELVSPGEKCLPWQIWRSNSFGIKAQLKLLGIGDRYIHSFHVDDNIRTLSSDLTTILENHQVIILSGGVSAGKFDFIHTVLKELGVDIRFHKVCQKPGKPLLLGTGQQNQCVFGLPGNPVSALVCMRRYVVPCLQRSFGLRSPALRAVLCKEVKFKKPLTLFAPVALDDGACETLSAMPLDSNGSGDFFSLAGSHGFCELPTGRDIFYQGESYPLYLWEGWPC